MLTASGAGAVSVPRRYHSQSACPNTDSYWQKSIRSPTRNSPATAMHGTIILLCNFNPPVTRLRGLQFFYQISLLGPNALRVSINSLSTRLDETPHPIGTQQTAQIYLTALF